MTGKVPITHTGMGGSKDIGPSYRHSNMQVYEYLQDGTDVNGANAGSFVVLQRPEKCLASQWNSPD